MKQLLLLLRHYSFLPLPQRGQQPDVDLPRALWLLPLWGLAAGLLCWGAACLLWSMSAYWAAALLLGVNVLLNGGVWLRDVLLIAEGRRTLTAGAPAEATPHASKLNQPAGFGPAIFGGRALLIGGLYLAQQYLCLLALLRMTQQPFAYVAAAVCCRWVYLWGVYDFAALRPAWLHLGLEKRHFIRAGLIALPLLAVCAAADAALWLPLLAALLLAWLLYRRRLRYLGALDEAAYGAAAACAELLLYVVYVLF